MFLHLGNDKVVSLSSVIAILDIKAAKSAATGQYIKKVCEDKKINVIDISENNAKSMIITKEAIYFSVISSHTLKKRAEFDNIANYTIS